MNRFLSGLELLAPSAAFKGSAGADSMKAVPPGAIPALAPLTSIEDVRDVL